MYWVQRRGGLYERVEDYVGWIGKWSGGWGKIYRILVRFWRSKS